MTKNVSALHWRCQAQGCGQPIGGERPGFIEIYNANIDLGPIGRFPVLASPDEIEDRERVPGKPPEVIKAAELGDLLDLMRPNIGFRAYHKACDRTGDPGAYWFEADAVPTLEKWIARIEHVSEKSWMGKRDTVAMLRFWWSHRGDPTPLRRGL